MRINPEEIPELIDAAHEYNCKQENEQFIFVSEITSTNYTILKILTKEDNLKMSVFGWNAGRKKRKKKSRKFR